MNPLFAVSLPRDFSPTEERAFASALDDLQAETTFESIDDPKMLRLEHNGRTPGGWRYTLTAFKQTCGLLCSGLGSTLTDVLAISDQDQEPNVDLAVETFNRYLDERFDAKISGRRLVARPDLGVIDGITGPGYQYLANDELFRLVGEVLDRSEFAFAGARLVDRNTTFVVKRPALTNRPEPYALGYYFGNGETGTASLRCAFAVVRIADNGLALAKVNQYRCVHAGINLQHRALRLIRSVIEASPTPDFIRQQLLAAAAKPADVAGLEIAQLRSLELKLLSLDVPPNLAKRISREIVNKLNAKVYDVFTTLITEAMNQSNTAIREIVAGAAYGWLTKRHPNRKGDSHVE